MDPLLFDGVIAAIIALVVLIASPGVAIAVILAVIALIVCGVTLLWDRRRGRRPPVVRSRRR
jgi:hypothetical protein